MADLKASCRRIMAAYRGEPADRVPIIDIPWTATIERWQREGLPADVSFVDYCGLDHVAGIVKAARAPVEQVQHPGRQPHPGLGGRAGEVEHAAIEQHARPGAAGGVHVGHKLH